ncbi:hypothetical protein [Georgenia sp. SUBG003]|uniref:hypothetical protein n=1 Tax=Georgenia sp. SUBG003 TaxID=1497974 RepID=UPI003AB5C58A
MSVDQKNSPDRTRGAPRLQADPPAGTRPRDHRGDGAVPRRGLGRDRALRHRAELRLPRPRPRADPAAGPAHRPRSSITGQIDLRCSPRSSRRWLSEPPTTSGAVLGRHAVGIVLVRPEPTYVPAGTEPTTAERAALVEQLDATAGLERVTENDSGAVWRVSREEGQPGAADSVARARVVDADGAWVQDVEAGQVRIGTELPSGPEGAHACAGGARRRRLARVVRRAPAAGDHRRVAAGVRPARPHRDPDRGLRGRRAPGRGRGRRVSSSA